MQERARILADRIEQNRIRRFGDGLAQDLDRLGFKAAKPDVTVAPIHRCGWRWCERVAKRIASAQNLVMRAPRARS
jgi:hypothetical protein